jgi:hypothetical protein
MNLTSKQGITFVTDDPVQDLTDLSHIMLNLRHYSALFNEKFGWDNRVKKKYWEEKADRWLEQHTKPL